MKPPTEIDWADIHRRIEAMGLALDERFSLSPEKEAELLKARAHELARVPEATHASHGKLEVAVFALANECYALPLPAVREVGVFKELTPVPGTPDFVAGIINLRGEIHTVIDLKKFFGLPGDRGGKTTCVLVLAGESLKMGIVADAILGVRTLEPEELQPSLPTLTGVRAGFLRGITADRLIVLDAGHLLSDPRIIVDHSNPS